MEIKQIIAIVLRWLWLLIIGIILGVGVAYAFSIRQEKIYQSSTRVQVMSAPQSGNDAYSYFNDQQLAKTYVQTLKNRPLLDEVEKQLGSNISSGQIIARVVPETQLIDITVEYTDPQKAADIANSLVKIFTERNNELQSSRFLESEQSLQNQLAQVDLQIQSLQTQSTEVSSAETEATLAKAKSESTKLEDEILALQEEIDTLNDLPVVAYRQTATPAPSDKSLLNEKEMRLNLLKNTYDLYQQIYINLTVMGKAASNESMSASNDKLQSTLALYEQIRANLLGSYEDVRLARLNSTSNIVQIEPAEPRNTPIRPQTPRDMAMGGAVGLLLAGVLVFLIEYMDDTVKNPEQISRILGLPVIGYIGDISHKKDSPYVLENPRSPISEAFRTLRTNIEFAAVEPPLKTILVVSANPSEGKSTIAANLAVSIFQGGKKVLLIDADLRRPRIHRFFGLSNRVGLTDLFRESIPLSDITHLWKDTSLSIITSGGIPANSADLLSSKRMASLMDEAKQVADIVIVDAPPFLVADASILAARMDGVLLVIQPGKTPMDTVKMTLEQMNRAGANIIGVIMNRIPRNRTDYYGGYRYYSSHYYGKYHNLYD